MTSVVPGASFVKVPTLPVSVVVPQKSLPRRGSFSGTTHGRRWIFVSHALTRLGKFIAGLPRPGWFPDARLSWREDPQTGCWVWGGTYNPGGYGVMHSAFGPTQLAHRILFGYKYRVILDNWVLDHVCEHKYCVNPEHLDIVSLSENTKRTWKRADPARRKRMSKFYFGSRQDAH